MASVTKATAAGEVKPAVVVKQTAEAAASKNVTSAGGTQRSIWRTVSHGNTAFIGFHATSRVCEYANSQWQKGGANVLVAAVAYTVGQVFAIALDIVKTAFTLLTLPLPLLPGFHVILNAFQGTRSDLYGSYIDFTAMRNLNNSIAKGDELRVLMKQLAQAEATFTNELSLAQMDQGNHAVMVESSQVATTARQAIIDNILKNTSLKATGVLSEIDAQVKHLDDLKNRPYPLRTYDGDTQERVTVSLTDRVIAKLKGQVYDTVVEKFARELRADLHQELSHAQIFNEQADELLNDVATIDGHDYETSKEDLKDLLKHNRKDFEAAFKKLEQACASEKAWNDFVATRQKVTQAEVNALQKHFNESPADLIAKLNASMPCDIGAGTRNHANKIVETIPGLNIAKDAKFADVQKIVDAKVDELKEIINNFEETNNAISIWNVMQGWSDVEFNKASIEDKYPGFIEYQKAVCQLWHLEKGSGYNTHNTQMDERAKQLAEKEGELADVAGACQVEVASRKLLIDTYAPGEAFEWNHVNQYLAARETTNVDDSARAEVPDTAEDSARQATGTDEAAPEAPHVDVAPQPAAAPKRRLNFGGLSS